MAALAEAMSRLALPADVVVFDSKSSEADLEGLRRSIAAAHEAGAVGLDCEGVDLGAFGQLTLVQIATPDGGCSLFDMIDKPGAPVMEMLKGVLESPSIVKIIHDCKADSEALSAECGIKLLNVHDTMAWQEVLSGTRMNLNNTLTRHGIETNGARDGNVYKANQAFWADRPLTAKMIAWASADVAALFKLRDGQSAGASPSQTARCEAESAKNLARFRDAQRAKVPIHTTQVGAVIGRGGSNIRTLEAITRTEMALRGDKSSSPYVIVYGETAQIVGKARGALSKYKTAFVQHHQRRYDRYDYDDYRDNDEDAYGDHDEDHYFDFD
jgi:hypothetical protein